MQEARALIDTLPVLSDQPGYSFYEIPDTTSASKRDQWSKASKTLDQMAAISSFENSVVLKCWASDAAVGAKELERALELLPVLDPLQRSSGITSNILNLKKALGLKITGRDVLSLFGARLTKFGRENIEDVLQYLTLRVDALSNEENRDLISEWAGDAHEHGAGYNLFSGHASYIVCKPPEGLHYQYSKTAEQECLGLIRDAENTWREEAGIPKIGEGWVSETKLYYEIKEAFPELVVEHHARPQWLGRQHLDIFIPELKVAIEYQGAQHDRPIAFFGGEAAFLENVKRDRRKKAKCTKNGVKVIYVREGYVLAETLQEIRNTN